MIRQLDRKPQMRDTVFMSGWLFADLLLALAVLFLAANTIGIKIPPPPPPKLVVTPTSLSAQSPNCPSVSGQPLCTVTVIETADSVGDVDWTASSDISQGPIFSPANGHLSPGKSVSLQIAHMPCENDSLSVSGSRGTVPVKILWQCTPRQERLDFHYQRQTFDNVDTGGLLSNSSQAINDFKGRIKGWPQIRGRSVGLVVVYGGAPGDGDIPYAQQVADKVKDVLRSMVRDGFPVFQRASYYDSLYTLGSPSSTVQIDVYLFTQ